MSFNHIVVSLNVHRVAAGFVFLSIAHTKAVKLPQTCWRGISAFRGDASLCVRRDFHWQQQTFLGGPSRSWVFKEQSVIEASWLSTRTPRQRPGPQLWVQIWQSQTCVSVGEPSDLEPPMEATVCSLESVAVEALAQLCPVHLAWWEGVEQEPVSAWEEVWVEVLELDWVLAEVLSLSVEASVWVPVEPEQRGSGLVWLHWEPV